MRAFFPPFWHLWGKIITLMKWSINDRPSRTCGARALTTLLLLIPGNQPAPWRHIVVNKHYLPSSLPVIRIMKGRRSHRRCHRHWQLMHLVSWQPLFTAKRLFKKKGKRHKTWHQLINPKRNRDGHLSLSHVVSLICLKWRKSSPKKRPDLRSIHIWDLLGVNYCVNFSGLTITKNDYKFNYRLCITISCGTISWWIDLG